MLTTVMDKFYTKISDLVRKALKSFAQISNPHFPENRKSFKSDIKSNLS